MRAVGVCLSILVLPLLQAVAQDVTKATPIRVEEISHDLEFPIQVTSAGQQPSKLYIVEKQGTVRVLEGGKLLATDLLDIETIISSKQPHGLMGIAFPRDFHQSNVFYVNFMDAQGDTIIGRFPALKGDAADEDSLTVVMKLAQLSPNEHGSHIEFGADGFLYISSGDGGGTDEHTEASQRLNSLNGKILRIDPSITPKYGTPKDNPFQGDPKAYPEIWALGFHNPRYFSFDRDSGRMLLIDSHTRLDELHLIETGKNYGWNIALGTECVRLPCDLKNFERPVFTQSASQSTGRITGVMIGGVVYRGNKITALRGKYVFADQASGQIYAIEETAETWRAEPIIKLAGNAPERTLGRGLAQTITSIGEDASGEIFITTQEGALLALTKP